MSITSQDLIDLATKKATSAKDEVEIRCVISRAYYAAYHHAYNFHNKLSIPGRPPEKSMGMHATLIYQLNHPNVPHGDANKLKSISIGTILQDIYKLRKQADYFIGESVTLNEAQAAIAEAKRVLAK